MTETTHSPLPWTSHADGHCYHRIKSSTRHLVARDLDEPDAAFIVRAVNTHEQLLAACREAERFIYADLADAHVGVMLKQLRTAIAAAEPQ
jgi:hypothetical protein